MSNGISRLLLGLALYSLFCVSSAPAFAQDCSQAWKQKYPSARYESSIAYDSQRGRLVVFGGESYTIVDGRTWEWDGTIWHLMSSEGPDPRFEHRLVYDSTRHVTVLFGGTTGGGRLGDTWEWDGVQWTQRHPELSPAARLSHAMVYDSARQRVVLFGGNDSVDENSETWEWDGNNWEQRFPANHPSGRRTSAMAYDSARQVVVLWGGYTGSQSPYISDETWEWNGTDWTLREPEHRPAAHDRVSMAYDNLRGVSVLFTYSADYYNRYAETWEWNGTDWSKHSPIQSPPPSDWPALTFDTTLNRVVMFSGYAYTGTSGESGDLWMFDPDTNTWLTSFIQPSPRAHVGMAYDNARSRTVMYGGQIPAQYYWPPINETWEEDGTRWIRREPTHSPPALYNSVLAFDSQRQKTVLFGGYGDSGPVSQTWEWDGTDWTQRSPVTVPAARYGASMSYDAARGVVVMTGGFDLSVFIDETWEWNGTDWTRQVPPASPGGRHAAGMVYDPLREVTVLYGGLQNGWPPNNSVWEWNGAAWNEVTAGPGPNQSNHASLVYSPLLQRTLFRGVEGTQTWAWNGTLWQDLQVGGLGQRMYSAMVFDEGRGQALHFGGQVNNANYWRHTGDTHVLDAADQDLDGTLDCADGCPADPLKIAAGICGCGIVDADDDGDQAYNCNEECDADPLKTDPGQCGCGVADTDGDSDGTPNCTDLCPVDPDKIAAGVCGCGISDADTDQDQTPNCQDLCPADPGKIAAGVCGCGVPDTDVNGNTVLDCLDAGIATVTPAAPKLKLKKKRTSVEMTSAQGVKYVLRYRWLTGKKAKDRKIKYKNLISAAPSVLLKGAKIGFTLALSYHYLVDGPEVYQSLESREVKLKVKKFPKK